MVTAALTVTTIRRALPVVVSSMDDTDLPSLNAIYAHGAMEDRMGWDCLCGSVSMKPGIHPVIYCDEHGGESSALAFIWRDADTGGRTCGLVVLSDDQTSIRHAMQRMLLSKGC